MNKAEVFNTIEEFNAEIVKDLPLVAFSRWFELGSLVEDLGKQSRRLKNNTLPNNKLGLYIIGVKLPGGEDITMIYFGVAVGPKSGGVRNRANAHFSYSQNDGAHPRRESGLLAAARAIGLVGTYYASYYECDDAEICDRIESVVLYKYDFICNYEKKQVRARRIPDLVMRLPLSEVDSEEEGEDINTINPGSATAAATAAATATATATTAATATAATATTAATSATVETVPAVPVNSCVKPNMRAQLFGLPIRKPKQVSPTSVPDSLIAAYCGCGKIHRANRNNVTIICSCATTFKFSD